MCKNIYIEFIFILVYMKDYYQILEINKNSDKNTIKNAYKKLALKYHPDKNMQNKEESEKKFKEISEAYEILGDDEKKKNYDNGQNVVIQNSNPFDIFENIFKNHNMSFNIDLNNIGNINNINTHTNFTSTNTSTQIIGNKKITRIQKTIKTSNGTQTTVEEKTEFI